MFFNDLLNNYTSNDYSSVQNTEFVENSNGTAILTGQIFSQANASWSFNYTVVFRGRTYSPPAGSPKESTQCIGDLNNSDWYYYTDFEGTLVGTNAFAGAVVGLTPTGTSFQVGTGANLNSASEFGASGWFNIVVKKQPSSGPALVNGSKGDFNINLSGTNWMIPLPLA